MSLNAEAKFQSKLINVLDNHKIWNIKTMITSRAGCPDIIACSNTLFVAIEVKTDKGKLSPLQEVVKTQITSRMSHGLYLVVRPSTFELFKDHVKDHFYHLRYSKDYDKFI